jgi:hypothetical protein
MVLGCEYQYRNGTESTLPWGDANGKNICPATQAVDEATHILKFDVTNDPGAWHLEDSTGVEFYTEKNQEAKAGVLGGGAVPDLSINARDNYHQVQGMNRLMPLYVSLYKGQGSLLAWLAFSKSSSGLTTNNACWFMDSITLFKPDAIDLSASAEVTISGKTRLFTGSFKDPASGATVHCQGAVLQQSRAGDGYFIGGGLSGAVVIETSNSRSN